jgi:hypothetical protein
MKLKILILTALCATSVWATDDNSENRIREAGRYLAAAPPQQLFQNLAEQMARNLPPGQKESFTAALIRNLDVEAVSKVMQAALVKHFTAGELKALADFYGSDVGRSAMKKFGAYMGDVMPAMQAEIMKAMEKANRDTPSQRKE